MSAKHETPDVVINPLLQKKKGGNIGQILHNIRQIGLQCIESRHSRRDKSVAWYKDFLYRTRKKKILMTR
jgi:hypothetical protein